MMKVIGNVKAYDNKTHVLVYDASVVTDFNELTYHLLDVILVHCQQTKGPIPVSIATASRTVYSRLISIRPTIFRALCR